ncbi:MAG: UDP-3-O-(3-hydroxymyristoyl)glucosamine N-acyltransferase [Myxococcota bacterium]
MSLGPAKTVRELCLLVGGQLVAGEPARAIARVMPIDAAEPDAVTFVTKPKFLPALATTRAGAVMISPQLLADAPKMSQEVAVITVDSPYAAFAKAAQAFARPPPRPSGRHPSAVIEPSADVSPSAAIGPFVYVGAGAVIGDRAVLYAGVHVEAGASVGADTVLFDHVVLRHGSIVGARCILHPGVVIGADGFGFAQEALESGVVHLKIPQTGNVVIEDDVEIGANACVDRAALGTTRIGAGTKIDNLVQIGHNAEIGPASILVAQSGVAGSSKLGRGVILGAQAGISGHLDIGDGVMVYGQAGVMNDLPAKEKVAGTPARPIAEFFKTVVRVYKLEELAKRVKRLEQK